MKKTIFAGIICIASMAACNNSSSTDSKEMAKDANAQNADSMAKMNKGDNNMSASDMKADDNFAVNAADGGMAEVQMSMLAKTNGMSAGVKSLADMMIADHTKAGDELKGIAQKNNIMLPATLSDKMQKSYNDLAAKKGADFDKAYVDQMMTDHKETIDKFQTESDKGNNADLKAFAMKTLPTLKGHLDMVNKTKDGMK